MAHPQKKISASVPGGQISEPKACRLGFVINANPTNGTCELTQAIVQIAHGNARSWYLADLSPARYPRRDSARSVRAYFSCLFALALRAKRSVPHSKATDPVPLAKPCPPWEAVIASVHPKHMEARRDCAAAPDILPTLRRAINNGFFKARGRGPATKKLKGTASDKRRVEWQNDADLDGLFYWTSADMVDAGIQPHAGPPIRSIDPPLNGPVTNDGLRSTLEAIEARLENWLQDPNLAELPLTLSPVSGPDLPSRTVAPPFAPGLDGPSEFVPIRDELRIGQDVEPVWFRRGGPIESDFLGGTVALPDITDLKQTLLEHPFVLLHGGTATGKTTSARYLSYVLYQEGHQVYYTTLPPAVVPLDVARLSHDVRRFRGVFILNEAHLRPGEIERFVHLTGWTHGNHVLLVARDGLEDHLQHSRAFEAAEIPTVALTQRTVAGIRNAIVDQYPLDFAIERTSAFKADLFGTVGTDLWLLSYAVQAAAAQKGVGTASEWLRNGVRLELDRLEQCGDQDAAYYPSCLLALAPLGMYELPTERRYLESLRLPPQVLLALARRGEITREGSRFYGLPHAALARAYWAHGQTFNRHLPSDLTTCILNYIRYPKGESFSVVAALHDYDTGVDSRRVIESLAERGELEGLVRREAHLPTLWRAVNVFSRHGVLSGSLLDAIATHVADYGTLSEVDESWWVLDEAAISNVWPTINPSRMLEKSLRRDALEEVISYIEYSHLVPPMRECLPLERLLEGLSDDQVVRLLESEAPLEQVSWFVAHTALAGDKGRKCLQRWLRKCNTSMLLEQVESCLEVSIVARLLSAIARIDPSLAKALWQDVDHDRLREQCADLDQFRWYFRAVDASAKSWRRCDPFPDLQDGVHVKVVSGRYVTLNGVVRTRPAPNYATIQNGTNVDEKGIRRPTVFDVDVKDLRIVDDQLRLLPKVARSDIR